jgi:nicotinamidase-related amidase
VPVALLLIDVLTTFQFPNGDAMLQGALGRRDALVSLKARTGEAGVPVLYLNDNFGDWRSEKEVLMSRCLEAKGEPFVRPLLPDGEDYFVLKPMHTAFYMTPLKVETLILTGLTSNSCITVTAHDANMRGFDIYIPPDCSCAQPEEHMESLAQWVRWLERSSVVRLRLSCRISFVQRGSLRGRVRRASLGKSEVWQQLVSSVLDFNASAFGK